MRTVVAFVIGVGWIAFWAAWLAAALTAKASTEPGQRYIAARVVLVIAAFAAFRLLRAHHFSLPVPGPAVEVIGLVLWAAGLGLAVWARVYLGRNWGLPMSRKEQPELVTTGPYRVIRNPIYTGIIAALIGTALALSLYWLAVAAVAAGFFVYSAVREGRYLAAEFPEAYPAYERSTKMLIPFVF